MSIVYLLKLAKEVIKLYGTWGQDNGYCLLIVIMLSLFTSPIKIRAANGTLIENKGECDISFKIGPIKFTFPFLCSAQLSQQFILGYNFPKAFHIGTTWSADDTMSLTHQGKTIAQTIPTKEINSIVFCCESTVIPPLSNAKIKCSAPKVKSRANCGQNLLFEPSNRHKSNYVDCNTYNGLVTFDEHTAGSGSFDIVMTNNSSQHVKVTKNQTLGMLKSCDQDQICTIHRLVTFEPKSLGGEGINPDQTKQSHDNSIENTSLRYNSFNCSRKEASSQWKLKHTTANFIPNGRF